MTAVFLQVRLDSSRLPRKALADLGGRTVVERCMDALEGVRVDRHVLVTEPDSADDLRPLLPPRWSLFVGSKDLVLDRFVQAARVHGATTVIRATGDNPLVSAALALRLLERHRATGADYSAFNGGPIGTGVEILQTSALETAWGSQPDSYEQEHVSPFLYRRPDRFRIDRTPVAPACHYPQGRVTLDTSEDLAFLQALWSGVYRGVPPEVEELIPWLTQHPR